MCTYENKTDCNFLLLDASKAFYRVELYIINYSIDHRNVSNCITIIDKYVY